MCATGLRRPLDIESMSWLGASQAAEASGSRPLPSLKAQKGSKRCVDDDDDQPAEAQKPVAPNTRTCSRISVHWSVMI